MRSPSVILFSVPCIRPSFFSILPHYSPTGSCALLLHYCRETAFCYLDSPPDISRHLTALSLPIYVQKIGSDFNRLENKTTKHFSMLSTRLENVFTAV